MERKIDFIIYFLFCFISLKSQFLHAFGGITFKSNEVKVDKINFAGLEIRNIIGKVRQKGGIINIYNIRASMYGGEVIGDMKIGIDPYHNGCTLSLYFNEVDISKLPKKYIGNSKLQGKMNGNIFFNTMDRSDISGKGEFFIKDGKLIKLPLIIAFFDILDLPLRKERIITDAYGKFIFKKEGVIFSSLIFTGEDVKFKGKGTVSYKGLLNMSFKIYVKNKLLKKIPIAGSLAQLVITGVGNIIPTVVTGTITNPKIKLGIVPQPLDFKKRKSEKEYKHERESSRYHH